MNQLFRRKPISELLPDDTHSLKRVLGAGDLIMLAIGAVIGAGIFGAIGTAAAGRARPARLRSQRRRRARSDVMAWSSVTAPGPLSSFHFFCSAPRVRSRRCAT